MEQYIHNSAAKLFTSKDLFTQGYPAC